MRKHKICVKSKNVLFPSYVSIYENKWWASNNKNFIACIDENENFSFKIIKQ